MKQWKKNQHPFTLFWLPNMVSLFNLFTGFFSILMVAEGRLRTAAWLIFVSLLWDSLDGNIARALKNQSAFGRELDSLADIVSFVVAPCLIVLKAWSYKFVPWTLIPVFFYLAGGAYRLARFNIRPPVKNYFEGLPTPAGAVVVAMTVLAYKKNDWTDVTLFIFVLVALMSVTSFLMVSRIPYPKLSAIKFSRWQSFFYLEFVLFVLVSFAMNLETALAAIFLAFLFLAPAYCLPSPISTDSPKEQWMTKSVK